MLQNCCTYGNKSCEGYFCFNSDGERECIYEFLKTELKKDRYGEYKFTAVRLTKYDSTQDAAFYHLKFYISWLRKKHKKNQIANRSSQPFEEIDRQMYEFEERRTYGKKQAEQFKKVQPNWGWIKPLLITIAIICYIIVSSILSKFLG